MWLDLRLELHAHVRAMERLAAADLDPTVVVKYIRSMNPKHFNQTQMRYLVSTTDGALGDLRIAIELATRLK